MAVRPTDLQLHELAVQRAPDHYTVAAFRGSGQFDRAAAPTFGEAHALARGLYKDRPVPVYAVRGNHQSHIVNVTNQEPRMTYLLTRRNYVDDLKITVYAERPMAEGALRTIADSAVSGLVVDSPDDLVGSNQLLADMFNALHTLEDPAVVQRFSQKSDGQRRLFDRIESRAKGQPVLSVPVALPEEASSGAPSTTTEENADMAAKKGRKAKKTSAKKAAAGGAKRERTDKDKKIKVLVENPKREGSAAWERFKLYKDDMTVAKALEKGVWPADIRWDVKQKFIRLVD